jgi:histidinol-phosphate/aromatic aminotransferase/cobyric acid decarboxylase-like protein
MPLPFTTNLVLKNLPVYQPGRPIEEVARELGLKAEEIIKLASNENPLGPSRLAVRAMRQALAQVNLYPDGNAYYLKQKLAAKLRLSPANLILGNGSNEVIELIRHALLPRRAQETPEPTKELSHAATPGPAHEEMTATGPAVEALAWLGKRR